MELVSIELKNCYGIKVLKKDLDFSKSPAYALYAPNGVMKSSLAQTFQDAANKNDSQDRIFAERKTVRKIVDENGKEIEGDRVLVVLPYDSEYGPTEKTSTLLVDAKLRKEHEKLQLAVDEASGKLLKAIGQQAGSKRDFEEEISSSIMRSADKFENAVARLQKEISQQKETPFANVSYDIIFNDKVQKALETKGLKDAVEDYIHRYNELIASSTYFRKGTFDYYNAGQIAKSLADNGFFNAKHTVNLKSTGGAIEITNQDQLEEVIVSEKEKIISDKKLREKFNSVQKQLEKNAELREFCHYLEDNDALLSRMNNMEQFREDVLKSYLKVHEGLYNELMATLESVELGRKRIAAEAEKQRTQWDEVIRIFNDRFVVPFDLVT